MREIFTFFELDAELLVQGLSLALQAVGWVLAFDFVVVVLVAATAYQKRAISQNIANVELHKGQQVIVVVISGGAGR